MKALLFALFIAANESLPAPEPMLLGVPSAYWPGPLTMQECYLLAERINANFPVFTLRQGHKVLPVKLACLATNPALAGQGE